MKKIFEKKAHIKNILPNTSESKDFFKMLEIFSLCIRYAIFLKSKANKYIRINEYLIYEVVKIKHTKLNILKFHIRSDPMHSVVSKYNKFEILPCILEKSDELLRDNSNIKKVELITHNKILTEKIVHKFLPNFIKDYSATRFVIKSYDILKIA
ncbi:MAG: hypothetical protein ACRDDH_17045 [Cetobacterium sp.]|uniref:hypothetical protein n=1 Tax=Cetobacterium sp. TaxID=2071632 RepID=UPI003EE4BE7E